MEILSFDELRNANTSVEFVGADHGDTGVSFFVGYAPPGRGPSLHRHEYPEVFIVLEGQANFRAGDAEQEVSAGHIVIVPPGEPHAFTASGNGSTQVNIHVSPRFVTEWIEEEAYG
jgi:quercetin dioxygenase-like cupin family protein